MEIRCSEKADKQIKKICKGDRKSAKIIAKAINHRGGELDVCNG